MSGIDNDDRSHNEEFQSSAARLSSSREKQLIRLVNGSDDHIAFAFRLAASLSDKKITVKPDRGIIRPRDYLIVKVECLDKNSQATRLGLFYWKTGLYTKNSRRYGGLVHIDVDMSKSKIGRHEDCIYRLSLRVMRSIILIALITYNIILIKLNLY